MDQGLEHIPTKETKAKVHSLASFGHPTAEIAKYLDISEPTLFKYYKPELAKSLADSITWVKGKLFERIEAGDVKAMTVFLARRGGWKSADKVAELEILDKIAQAQTLSDAQTRLNELTAEKEEKNAY